MLVSIEQLEQRLQFSSTLAINGAQSLIANPAHDLSSTPGGPHEAEMLVAVNPTNPRNIVGLTDSGSSFRLFEHWSMNGGLTWNKHEFDAAQDDDSGFHRYDPSLAFDANGALYIAYVDGNTGMRLVTSLDGGATLQKRPQIPFVTNADKPMIGVGTETTGGTKSVSVYITYSSSIRDVVRVVGAYGADVLNWVEGGTDAFTTPTAISNSAGYSFSQPVVGANGQLYVSRTLPGSSVIQMNSDANGLASGITFGATTLVYQDSGSGLYGTQIHADTNRGVFTGPVIDVDRRTGDLFLAFLGLKNPSLPLSDSNPTTVYVTRCTNPDAASPVWDTATAVDTSAGYQFLPWLAVDQTTGSVNIIYYTTNGNAAGDQVSARPRVSTSFNAAGTWASASFTHQNLTNDVSVPVAPDDYLEYIGIAAFDNTLSAMWASSFKPDGTTNDMDAFFASAALISSTSANVLTVTGDDGLVVTDDNIVIRRDPLNPNYVDAIVNGKIQFASLFSTVNQISVDGKAGNNTITVDFSSGNPLPGGLISLVGGQGANTFKVIGAATGNTFSTSGTTSIIVNGTAIHYIQFHALIVDGGAGNDTLNDAGVPSAITFEGGAGNDTLNLTGGTLAFNADALLTTANLTLNVSSGATAFFNSAQHLAALAINGNGTAVMPSNVIGTEVYVNTLAIGLTGLLDLGRSFLYVDNTATPFSLIHQYINAGYHINSSTGVGDYMGRGGITSSDVKANIDYKGVGYYDGSLQTAGNANNIGQILGPSSNSGAGTGIALTKILIRPTLTGDVNGDGVVNQYDVNIFNTFGLFNMSTPLGYQVGDFNGDGVVDSKDVNIFNSAGNYNNGVYM